MSHIQWKEVLGWSEKEIEDFRIVGYSYIKQGKYEIALKIFDALVVLNPRSSYDLRTLGALYLQMNNHLLALNYLEQALKVDPRHFPTLLNRTKALYALGYRKQAEAQAQQLKLCPDPLIQSQAASLLLAYT